MTHRNPQQQKPKTIAALERTAKTMLMVLGSALPFIIAWILIASTNEDNPLDRIPDYDAPIQETLVLPLDRAATVETAYDYRGNVRVVIEGTATGTDGARRDAFYRFTDADGMPLETAQSQDSLFTIAGEPARAALELSGNMPPYSGDHTYTGVYPAGRNWTHITFGTAGDAADIASGELRITVVQIE